VLNGLAWLFARLGSASPRPTAKDYLAPVRMKVGALDPDQPSRSLSQQQAHGSF